MYDKLNVLQGKVIPKFYGYYEMDGLWEANPDCEFACILLEDCGDPIPFNGFFDFTQEDRKTIFKKLVEIHREGICPIHFSEDSIVVKQGDYRIIGLDKAWNHKCDWRDVMDQYMETSIHDYEKAFGCASLAMNGDKLGLWKLKYFDRERPEWPDYPEKEVPSTQTEE
ncbi:hypothetical protein SCHPADRAFT_900535 [Schizopora paradoxa]|uniref:Protein kinase domain-containing protein n=1 Tax=Schizopora paradoxa TaxID=27342 RepID=A0A0H2SKK3_9AGAM|nr:hypothetical protein SCHPADRAFT_900535 [Schizopora paradoxa]